MITELLENDLKEYAKDCPSVKGALDEDFIKKVLLKRKYGKGGESREHRELKKYISNHPEKIGLIKNEVNSFLEHKYISGDLVDILFESKNKSLDTVLEIELDNAIPGIHQIIKYRALRCAQIGYGLMNKRVKAVIVAWQFSRLEKELCKKYEIMFFEIKL